MSDDSFIREVDEELRSERVQNFWTKYGKLIIGGAVAIVLVTGGYRFYEYYTQQQAAKAGDAFMEAVRLSDEGKQDVALEKLKELETAGSPAYSALAKLRTASELAKKGDVKAAITSYDEVAELNGVDLNLRSIARLRAGALLVDNGSTTEVEARVGPLMGPGAPYRGSARELLALSYFGAGDLEKSSKLFGELVADQGTPATLKQRARLMLELIASQGGPKVTQ